MVDRDRVWIENEMIRDALWWAVSASIVGMMGVMGLTMWVRTAEASILLPIGSALCIMIGIFSTLTSVCCMIRHHYQCMLMPIGVEVRDSRYPSRAEMYRASKERGGSSPK